MKLFNNVAALKAASLTAGQIVETKGYYKAGDGGAGTYLIEDVGSPDGYIDHTLANANIAKLMVGSELNVRQCGAKGDWNGTQGNATLGVPAVVGTGTDDTAALQAAIDYGLANGAKVYFPQGRYRTTSVITIDKSAQGEFDPIDGNMSGFSISGASAGSAMIVADHNGVCLLYKAAQDADDPATIGYDEPTRGADWHTYFQLDGVGLMKGAYDRAVGSVGLKIDQMAYASITRFYIFGFEYGIYAEDCLSSTFDTGTLLSNEYGYEFRKKQRSNPNNINFKGVVVQGNNTWGGRIIKPHLFNIIGGSIESNGLGTATADASSWGLYVENSGNEGGVGLVMDGCYIEGNNGRADLWIFNSVGLASHRAIHHIKGTSFFRFTGGKYTTNQIFWQDGGSGTPGPHRLLLSGCAFIDFNPFSAAYKETFTASAAQTNFVYTFTNAPDANDSYAVWIDGQLQTLTTDYTIDTGTKTVTLNTPASGGETVVIVGSTTGALSNYISWAPTRKHIDGSDHTIMDAGNNRLLDDDGGNTCISRSLWSPIGTDSQIAFASLPPAGTFRNGIKYCQDGSGTNRPALAVSDGTSWWQMPLGRYAGAVDSAGAEINLPRGWTCSRPFNGVYTITHNLNTDHGVGQNDYAVTVTPRGGSATGVCSGMVHSGNSVEIYMTNLAGTATNMDFNFSIEII